MLALVGTSEGIALLPKLYLPPEPAGIRYVATDCAPHEFFAIWSKHHVNAHVPAFLEILREKIGKGKPAPATMKAEPKSLILKTRAAR